jgi:hypothetical protein
MRETEIFCPKCRWRPTPASRWVCSPRLGGCGTVWNTFDTRGVCPTCSWQWIITACLSCKQFSLHEEWYHDPNEDSQSREEKEPAFEDAG